MNLLEQWATFMERWNQEYEQIMKDLRKALLKIVRRMRGIPEFMDFCRQTQRKARRRAKYYRRMEFYKQQQKRKGRRNGR